MVSRDWGSALIDSPSLWTQIYIQNGEDEIARITTFLYLSKQCQLHVDVMTALPTVDALRLVMEHISRVRTIVVRPGASDAVTALRTEQWKPEASYILKCLSNGTHMPDIESPTCYGVTLRDDGRWYYPVILLQFAVAARVASTEELNRTWEEHIARYVQFLSTVTDSAT
jgi:hypothetical protein